MDATRDDEDRVTPETSATRSQSLRWATPPISTASTSNLNLSGSTS